MSVINAAAPVSDRSQPATDSRRFDHPPPAGELVGVEQFVADLLRRAHQAAQAVDEPDEARTILHIAHLFAEELTTRQPQFDRVAFIHAITGEPSQDVTT